MSLRLLAAIASGVVAPVGLPPTSLPIAPFVLAVPFALIAASRGPRDAFRLGAATAVPFFALHVAWLPTSFSDLLGPAFWAVFPLLVLALAAIWGATAAVARAVGGPGRGTLAVLAPTWIFVEWLRGLGFLGFPWGALGYGWLATPVAQWADVVGVAGLGLLTTVAAAALAAPFVGPPSSGPTLRTRLRWGVAGSGGRVRPRLRGAGPPFAVALLALAWWGGVVRLEAARADVRTADRTALLVQGDVDPLARAAGGALDFDVHLGLTEAAVAAEGAPPDLVVWPEAAVLRTPLEGFRGAPARAALEAAAPGATFVVGARARVEGGGANAVYTIDASGVRGRYDKHVLVPFGERWPLLEAWAPLYRAIFAAFGLPMLENTVPGPGPAALPGDGGAVGAYVCYESVFDAIPRRMVADGADVLINVTNDAWFARGAGARQHFDMGRLRTIETRRWMLRAANDGITAVVDPTGTVRAELPRGVRDTLVVRYAEREDVTPFVRWGHLTPWLLGTLVAGAAGGALARRV
ncbi:MAG: apolipoprotein N-acyltransferase [Trueperaceae bacterium]|nr:apolipoprotein N-acyltransferase [Trueperaceae bacterium]